ncbi:hypothetical protein AVEN_213326-1 [Araneus ventricosus]|uniref:MATH domain-containing protein n=1 Tax=Araneus ventricosus TaxID=182803 RepID=A0A4Y2ICL3_ARAVE|nr:hypothetical protein AVEN_213326-1 [Araneus ventricosus]
MEIQNTKAQFKIDWKIKNFEDLPPKKGQLLSSPTFVIDTLHNSQWVLHLYPDGDNDGNGQYTALYLVRKSDDDYAEDIMLDCQLSFVTSERMTVIPWKTTSVTWKTTNHTFQKGGRCGSQEFLEREKIVLYLEHGTLTVRCVVFQNGIDASTNGGCVAVSLIGTDQRSFEWIIEDFQDLQPGGKKVMPIKTASKDAHSMTMTLSMTSENILMVDISPVDGKRMRRAFCSLHAGKEPNFVCCGTDKIWFNEMKSEQNWSFPLLYSKEGLLDQQTNNSLHLVCYFKFSLGIEFEKIEYTYYRPLSDLKNESCDIM